MICSVLQLERLKNDNLSSVLPLEDQHLDGALQSLQNDFSQLDKVCYPCRLALAIGFFFSTTDYMTVYQANEHLESIFPIFKELPGSNNALERVLALELELAEALQERGENIHFQR